MVVHGISRESFTNCDFHLISKNVSLALAPQGFLKSLPKFCGVIVFTRAIYRAGANSCFFIQRERKTDENLSHDQFGFSRNRGSREAILNLINNYYLKALKKF